MEQGIEMTSNLSEKFILESIEDYTRAIQEYQEIYAQNEKKIESEDTSPKMRSLYKLFNETIDREIRFCQDQINKRITM